MTFVREMGLIKWKTKPKNGLNRVKGRIIIHSASGRLFLGWLSQWIIFPQPYDYSPDVN